MSNEPPNEQNDRLKILFTPFTDTAKIINLYNDSQGAYFSLLNYDIYAYKEYLVLCQRHLKSILKTTAHLLGRINRQEFHG